MENLSVVTGASSGIGLELARYATKKGYDLIIAADERSIEAAADELRRTGAEVTAVQADLSARAGVDQLYQAIQARNRPVDALLANAGRGLGQAFLDQDPEAWRKVVDTNVTGTLDLIQRVGRDMREAGRGRILITGSIAGFIPGAYQAVYNESKVFLDSFAFGFRNELKDSGVTLTCLMPGATETEFFDRAGMQDTKIGASKKDDAADVAPTGFEAMLKGQGDVVTGWMNKLQSAIANLTPAGMLAERHRMQAEPGSARR